VQKQALERRIVKGVETGSCHILHSRRCLNESCSRAIELRFTDLDLIFLWRAVVTFQPSVPGDFDLTVYVIDVAAGDKIPRRAGREHQITVISH
jgi:urease accessory protein